MKEKGKRKKVKFIGFIFVCFAYFAGSLFAQFPFPTEESIRQDFVKELKKKRGKDKKKSDKPTETNQIIATNQPAETEDDEIIKVETQLARTDVLVFDPKGVAVLGLKATDFEITEDKIPQEIGTFSLGDSEEVPRTIVLIIDYSGSQRPYIKTSVAAAKILVDKLNPQDRMAIVTDDVELITDFTRDKDLLKKSLDKLAGKANRGDNGKSMQYSALYSVLNEMFTSEDVRPIVIFQTDGDQLFGITSANATLDQMNLPYKTAFTDKQLMETIERSRATIYSVISGYSLLGLNPDEQRQKVEFNLEKERDKKSKADPKSAIVEQSRLFRQQTSMSVIAKLSGGFHEKLETPEQADAVYENILRGITNRYLIGYYPTNQERNGKRRTIKITVKNHPEYVVWGRKSYYTMPMEKEKK